MSFCHFDTAKLQQNDSKNIVNLSFYHTKFIYTFILIYNK